MAIQLLQKKAAPDAEQHPDIARFTKKRPRWKKIVLLVVVIAIAVFAWYTTRTKQMGLPVSIQSLTTGELIRTVNVSGTVQSDNNMKVYSTLGATIQQVNVKLGDKVQAGDVLAQLDTSDLEISIATKRAAMGLRQEDGSIVSSNDKELADMKADLAAGRYAPLVKAEQSVTTAAKSLSDARREFKEYNIDIDFAEDEMIGKERLMLAARKEKDAAAAICKKDNTAKHGLLGHTQDCLNKEQSFKVVQRNWKQSYEDYSSEISIYGKAIQDAILSYEGALTNKELEEQGAARKLVDLENSIKQNATADELSFRKLNMDLENSTIKTPISGTVTAVYADEGAPGNGLLFLIEDTEKLVITTNLKEYDIAEVAVAMPVTIKSESDAIADAQGSVKRISPTAVKAADGSTKTDGGVQFACDIAVETPDSGLMVGMNVRMNILTQKKLDVFSIPFDAIAVNEAGENIVYVAVDKEGGTFAEPKVITTGLETDFTVEISGDGLTAGDRVILTPTGLTSGAQVLLLPDTTR